MTDAMRYALFLGCTIPARARNYELSARKVAEKVGIELVDISDFICCGFPVKSGDILSSMVLGAYNLALTGQKGLDLCALCSSCASALTETGYHLSEDPTARQKINNHLASVNLKYEGKTRVRHFARILYEEIGLDSIKQHFQRNLKGLRVAVHYGCHYLKPSGIYDHFDEPEDPRSLDALVEITGAEVVDYSLKTKCCGGPVLAVDEKTALAVAREKLESIANAGAHAICLVCPFCSVMFDSNQKGIEAEFDKSYGLPVLYLTQLLGIAMGFDRKELGLNMNVVKTKDLLSKFYDEI